MKMGLTKVCSILVVLLVALYLFGCGGGSGSSATSTTPGNDGPTSVSSLTYQGSTTPLTHLYFEHFGPVAGVYNIDIIIAPAAATYGQFAPEGRYVYLEMYFPTSSVTPGTYNWSRTPGEVGTFSDFSDITFVINGGLSQTEGDLYWHDLTGGTVTIAISGSTYTINGNVTTTQGPATFSYVGPLTANW